MPGRRPPGQHDLLPHVARELIAASPVGRGDLVLDLGAGTGALTVPLAERGCRVVAVELDLRRVAVLRERVAPFGNVRVVHGDITSFRLPSRPFAVVANPPFVGSWRLLRRLLGDPRRVPLQWAWLVLASGTVAGVASDRPCHAEVHRWERSFDFRRGPWVGRSSFRPVPPVDARVLVATRR